jgi:hypothetical protein
MCIDKHPNVIAQTHFSVNQVVRLQDASRSPSFNSFLLACAYEYAVAIYFIFPDRVFLLGYNQAVNMFSSITIFSTYEVWFGILNHSGGTSFYFFIIA